MKLLFLLFLPFLLIANVLNPVSSFKASGGVTDMIVSDTKIYVATDEGCVDIFEVKSFKKSNSICVKPLIDFMGDEVASKVFSVDKIEGKTLLLSQGKMGYRKVDIFESGKLKSVIDVSDELAIAKAKFVDNTHILLALLSNDIMLFDIVKRKTIWSFQNSGSKFSDFALNEDRSEVVVADESGNIHVYSTKDAKLLRSLKGKNLDNVFKVDYKNGVIATAGQDRRSVIYTKNSSYFFKSTFLIYSVGLSPSAKLTAFQSSEDNDVSIFSTKSRKKFFTLKGNKMNISTILFLNEDELLISSDDSVVNYYKIDKVK